MPLGLRHGFTIAGAMLVVVALFGDEVRRGLRLVEGPLSPGFGPLQLVVLVAGVVLFLAGAVFHEAMWRRIRPATGRSAGDE